MVLIQRDLEELSNMDIQHEALNTIASIFPEWFRMAVMVMIAMLASAFVSLAKSRYIGVFVFSIWISNIMVSTVVAFFVDNMALYLVSDLDTKVEAALMIIVGITSRDLLELLEHKGLLWFKRRVGDDYQ